MKSAMVEYVQGAPPDRWHWCKNCSQYPPKVYNRRSTRPQHDLCDECEAKEANKNCKI